MDVEVAGVRWSLKLGELSGPGRAEVARLWSWCAPGWFTPPAALADPGSGRAVLLVGPSGAGKSTAAAQLGQHLAYLTDEAALLEEDPAHGRFVIHHHPKPLSLIPAGDHGTTAGVPTRKVHLAPTDLGLVKPEPAALPATVSAVILLDRRADAPAEPVIAPVPLLDGVMELGPQVSYLAATPLPLQRLRRLAASVGGFRRLSYRDGSDLLRAVAPLVAGDLD